MSGCKRLLDNEQIGNSVMERNLLEGEYIFKLVDKFDRGNHLLYKIIVYGC